MYVLIIILFLIALFVNIEVFENFHINKYLQYNDHTNFLFNNSRLGNTHNMSYDLRGEAYFPPRTNFPFDNSVICPSNSRCYTKNFN